MNNDQGALANRPERILVVEDDEAVGDMLTMLLEMEGYRVTLVQNATAALNVLLPNAASSDKQEIMPATLAADTRPAVVLLDLQLPGMSGECMIEQLHAVAPHAPPIIVLSAKREQVLEAVAAMHGVATVLPKPFPVDDLLSTISNVLAR